MATKKTLTVDSDGSLAKADMNGDGHLSEQELEMHLEFKRKELEDADAMRDAQGMLLYPSLVVICELTGLEQAGKILGDMAPTYFVSVAAIVAAFYGKEALMKKK